MGVYTAALNIGSFLTSVVTAPMAELLDEHCDLLLVGDSVGMVVHGLPNTVGVTLEMMILHGQAVMRGSLGRFATSRPRNRR